MGERWVLVFYLMFEFGLAFSTRGLLIQGITNDLALRTRFTNIPRVWETLLALPIISITGLVAIVNTGVGDWRRRSGWSR
jgi:hypothetical protein